MKLAHTDTTTDLALNLTHFENVAQGIRISVLT